MFDPPRYVDPLSWEPVPDWPSARYVAVDSGAGLSAALEFLRLTPHGLAQRLGRNARIAVNVGAIERACGFEAREVSLVLVAVSALVRCERVMALSDQRCWVEELVFGPSRLFLAVAESHVRHRGYEVNEVLVADVAPEEALTEVLSMVVDVANALNWSPRRVPPDGRVTRFAFLASPVSDKAKNAFADRVNRAFLKFGVIAAP